MAITDRPKVPPTERPRRLSWIVGGVLLSFIVANAVAQHASAEIDSLSDSIANNSSPSIASLAQLRTSVVDTEQLLGQSLGTGSPDPAILKQLDDAQASVDRNLNVYLDLPQFPGELAKWKALQVSCVRFDEAVLRTREVAKTDLSAARALYESSVRSASDRVRLAAMDAIEFNATNGTHLAARIKSIRWRAIWLGNLLVALCVGLGIGAGVWIRRLSRSHSRLLEARVEELGNFAGRVAHDIRSPLAGASLAANFLVRKASEPISIENGARIIRSLARADAIVQGLLDFATAGARRIPGARTSVRSVLADLTGQLTADAERAQVELVLEAVPAVMVACSDGVYLSLLDNLCRNAMKYMGSSTVRRVTIRVTEEQNRVRTEVSDTGPGIAEGLLARLFEPWFRGKQDGPSGFGLGLATVKRLAEGHGGSIGVKSRLGAGSSFWFYLPSAGPDDGTEDSEDLRADAPDPASLQRH